MKRRAFLIIGTAAAIAACQPAQPNGGEAKDRPAGPDPAETIRLVYAPYMSESAAFPPFRDQAPWSADLWSQLEAMIERSNQINEPIVDFDPVINGQDGRVSDLVVSTDGVVESSHATVRARFANFGRQEEILFDLIWENGGWRVDNIRNADWDLRAMLAQGGTPLIATGEEGR